MPWPFHKVFFLIKTIQLRSDSGFALHRMNAFLAGQIKYLFQIFEALYSQRKEPMAKRW